MSASLPTTDDRRPTSSVAIIGNDAVLAAAPATPVQLAHACLRRGFTVAVPASWGDELVAAEAVRRLASRERGPAVMCVCPFVRSRLLAPGPDLAPFLVSLVSPPVATARYLRAAYGDHAVHITYIGGCPSAEDIAIDACLTPDAFLADLAEYGIALSEQPLVFDSIVPPDRRRWCSLPGGAPTAEILWSDTDTRTLIEIDRDDVSTDLAQHILTREHVLLDLAPGLGCVCSGAISSLPPRSARVAVTAAEPPRALGPVIDPSAIVSLDIPVIEIPVIEAPASPAPTPAAAVAPVDETDVTDETDVADEDVADETDLTDEMERRLDEMLGVPIVDDDRVESDLEAQLDPEFAETWVPASSTARMGLVDVEPAHLDLPRLDVPRLDLHAMSVEPGIGILTDRSTAASALERVIEPEVAREPDVIASMATTVPPEPALSPEPAGLAAPTALPEPEPITTTTVSSVVRRRTSAPMPGRHPASSIPRATASDGRALPRAYVGKRRAPSGSIPSVAQSPRPMEPETERHETRPEPVPPPEPAASLSASADVTPSAEPSLPTVPSDSPTNQAGVEPSRPERAPVVRAVPAPTSNPSAIIVFLVALMALGLFVLRSLN